jgi:hypothetical protein
MFVLDKDIELISISDIEALIENKTRENRFIDYKRSLPDDGEKSKREFLADVSSFANSSGGCLVFGVEEKAGLPTKIRGVRIRNLEESILRLEHMILDSIDPRIEGVGIKGIWIKSDWYVILVKIARSWSAPHMVTYQGHGRFYARNSSGKHPLDVSEIKSSFAFSQSTIDTILDFRQERIKLLQKDITTTDRNKNAKVILHIVPFSFDKSSTYLDMSHFENSQILPKNLLGDGVMHQRFNFDGVLYTGESGFLQVFRGGAVELVEENFLSYRKGNAFISPSYESIIYNQIDEILVMQRFVGMQAPFLIMLTLMGVEGCYLGKSGELQLYDNQPIDRDLLVLPEAILSDFNMNPHLLLRPVFDTVWNAAGWPRSMNYDDNGVWVG